MGSRNKLDICLSRKKDQQDIAEEETEKQLLQTSTLATKTGIVEFSQESLSQARSTARNRKLPEQRVENLF